MCVFGQRTARDGIDADPAHVGHEALPASSGQLLTADLFPDRVGCLREQQIRSDVLMGQRKQPPSRVTVDLRQEPLDDDAGIDDEDASDSLRLVSQ
jgi:hypothetical protein